MTVTTAAVTDATTADALRMLGHEPETMSRAIRRKCLDCSGGSRAEVRNCLVPDCALFPFRMGKSPWRAPVSDTVREKRRKQLADLKNAREITEENVGGPPGGPHRHRVVAQKKAREIAGEVDSGASRGAGSQPVSAHKNPPKITEENDDCELPPVDVCSSAEKRR
jgi:hypothetical protein